MAEFTVKDRQTGEILCQGTQKECATYIGCDTSYFRKILKTQPEYGIKSKFSKYKLEQHGEVKQGGARLKDIVCCDCGVLMKNVGATKKRCPECQLKHHRIHAREYMRESRNSHPVCPNISNKNKDGCEGCIYFRGFFDVSKCCNYYLDTGKRRPCPPGKECTVKIERRGYREKEK